ncbi:hypothetical protein BWR60_06635 [Inquilinus limosus]|uniref:Uncharacterized protein n=1 Tax=Inquilinus limosus TaxID=171674 RepID=A0A211ZRG9_9PROT|nr:hypothetical protein BWR60_06635 [Inquilinus limosus]
MNYQEETKKAWTLYSNAYFTQLDTLLLGGIEIRGDKALLGNFGTTAQKPVKGKAANTKGDGTASITQGSVLNDVEWWPLLNDAWILGGITSGSDFYLASQKMPADDDIWDESFRRPRVLGRELIALASFGYQRTAHSKLGTAFVADDADRARGATFTAYLDAIGQYGSAAEIRAAILL